MDGLDPWPVHPAADNGTGAIITTLAMARAHFTSQLAGLKLHSFCRCLAKYEVMLFRIHVPPTHSSITIAHVPCPRVLSLHYRPFAAELLSRRRGGEDCGAVQRGPRLVGVVNDSQAGFCRVQRVLRKSDRWRKAAWFAHVAYSHGKIATDTLAFVGKNNSFDTLSLPFFLGGNDC